MGARRAVTEQRGFQTVHNGLLMILNKLQSPNRLSSTSICSLTAIKPLGRAKIMTGSFPKHRNISERICHFRDKVDAHVFAVVLVSTILVSFLRCRNRKRREASLYMARLNNWRSGVRFGMGLRCGGMVIYGEKEKLRVSKRGASGAGGRCCVGVVKGRTGFVERCDVWL